LVHSDYRNVRYQLLQTSAGLREFLERYGSIHGAFAHYNDRLEQAWEQQPFDKTFFLMMPFRPDVRYRSLTSVIKNVCENAGFKAIRVDDPDRRFAETLWDNLIVNMLS